MKVLLLGEYSRLHNSLKEGLVSLGHDVVLLGDGDGFKNFPVDISIRPVFINKFLIKKANVLLYKIFKWDLTLIERGLRFYFQLNKMKGFDVVQLINERPIKTVPWLERYLLKKIFRNNRKVFLLSCGADSFVVNYLFNNKDKYSMLTPYFENPKLKSDFQYILDYQKENHKKTHQLLMEHCQGVIASDFDYVMPLKEHSKFLGLIPNPINISKIEYKPITISNKIVILLGINKGNRLAKGVLYFEKALEIVEKKHPNKIEVLKVSNLPYNTYRSYYNKAHILLDQVFSHDQGYNALEAMARGKVVFTGAEDDFLNFYKLNEDEVCINAVPNVNSIVNKLSYLIENPEKIVEIGKNAHEFITKEHHYIEVAKKYTNTWMS